MTTAWAVAPAGRSWRQVDPLLEAVAPFVDSEAMQGRVHQVRWIPDRSTRIALDRGGGDAVVLEIAPTGVRRTRLADDHALPGLHLILDPARRDERLGELIGATVQRCDVQLVSYRPGSRCVLRCVVRARNTEQEFFIKVLADGVRRYVEANLAVGNVGSAHGIPQLVPPVVGVWTDLDAVVVSAVPGRSASAALAAEPSSPAVREALTASVGALLAMLHQTPPDPVFSANPWTGADELARIADYIPAAWHADPMTAPSLTWLVNALEESCPLDASTSFSHGSFRTGQVIVNGHGLTVLDLDAAGTADPARDLGNSMAYLAWKDVRRTDGNRSTRPLAEVLLEGYLAAGGRVREDSLAWWQAAAITKIAGRRYRSLHTSHWPKLPELLRIAADLLDLDARPGKGLPARPRLPRRQDHAWPLPDLTDPARMTVLLGPLLAPHAIGAEPPTIRGVRTLRIARGRRVVVRCEVTGLADDPEFIVVKDYAQTERAGITHENLVRLSNPPDPRSGIGVPVPLGVLPALGIVAYREAAGRPLTELPEDVALSVARRSGTWLDGIHRTSLPLSRQIDLARELSSVDEWAHEIGQANESLARPALDLAGALRKAASRLPEVSDVPIHKDFHPGHVLQAEDLTVTVIDLDEARMGDPALDVAHMSTYAEEMAVPWALGIRDSFIAGYGELPGDSPAVRLGFYAGYTRLKMAKQRVRSASSSRDLDDETAQTVVDLMKRGAACLDA
ncbi:MAG: phosphotransferase family protein [Aeromicrobium sp.]